MRKAEITVTIQPRPINVLVHMTALCSLCTHMPGNYGNKRVRGSVCAEARLCSIISYYLLKNTRLSRNPVLFTPLLF